MFGNSEAPLSNLHVRLGAHHEISQDLPNWLNINLSLKKKLSTAGWKLSYCDRPSQGGTGQQGANLIRRARWPLTCSGLLVMWPTAKIIRRRYDHTGYTVLRWGCTVTIRRFKGALMQLDGNGWHLVCHYLTLPIYWVPIHQAIIQPWFQRRWDAYLHRTGCDPFTILSDKVSCNKWLLLNSVDKD